MRSNDIITRLALTLWAMVTLILCFVVALLVNEMIKAGADPFSAFQPETDGLPEPAPHDFPGTASLGTREISLFFASEDGHGLHPESVTIEFSGRTVENCRRALQALIAGPRQDFLFPLLSDQTRPRALYLREEGELVVDLSSELLLDQHRPRSAEMESLMIYGIVNTMMQEALQGEDEKRVHAVRFLFDGVPPQESFPAHLDLGAPLVQDLRWMQAGTG